jgi:hypothetical protein
MDNGIITIYCRFQIGQKLFPVPFALEYILPLVSPCRDMIVCARVFNP